MPFLADSELKRLLQSSNPPIKGRDLPGNLDSINSQIQPCSVDLRISEVFLPFRDQESNVETVHRTSCHSLGVGESVKVTTAEGFDLNNDCGALVVAPARLTRRGLILPDIGHVDPGFHGQLRITIINMGREPYELKTGSTIVTVLLFHLSKAASVGLRQRTDGVQPYQGGLEDIRYLSADFLNIESRVKTLAGNVARTALGESGWRHAFFHWCLPIIIGILAGFATYYFRIESRLADLENKSKMFTDFQGRAERIKVLELKSQGLAVTTPPGVQDQKAGQQTEQKAAPTR
jgi:deoxycytidine triphosphate deaminase